MSERTLYCPDCDEHFVEDVTTCGDDFMSCIECPTCGREFTPRQYQDLWAELVAEAIDEATERRIYDRYGV